MRRVPEDEVDRMEALYLEGLSFAEVSERVGRPPSTIGVALRRRGVEIRGTTSRVRNGERTSGHESREEMFCQRFEVDGSCWTWTGAKKVEDGRATGQMQFEGLLLRAARIAHELWVGPIPGRHEVWQTCDNGLCVNPDHLVALPLGAHLRGVVRDGAYNRDVAGWRYDWAERRVSSPIVCGYGHFMLGRNRMTMPRPDGLVEARCRICWQAEVDELVEKPIVYHDETPLQRFRRERLEGIR